MRRTFYLALMLATAAFVLPTPQSGLAAEECDLGEFCNQPMPGIDCWYDGVWHYDTCTDGEEWCK